MKGNRNHKLCRPPPEAREVQRWTGSRWIPDDSKPGLAFSGLFPYVSSGGHHTSYPAAWTTERTERCSSTCVCNLAMTRTASRYGAANGRSVAPLKQ